jgi:hypothetical protein
MGIDVTESQLMLLSAMRFVEVKKEAAREKIVTTLPILGVKKKQALIQRVRAAAREIEPALREDLSALAKTLKDAGYEDRAFSILFSAVVAYHEWMWEFMRYLEEQGILKKPLAFADPRAARPKDIDRLLFVVKGSMK